MNNANCTATITPKTKSCLLKLKLIDFIVEDSGYCSQDVLVLDSSLHGRESAKLCGQHSGEEIVLKNIGKPWIFRFETDARGTTRGFYIKTEQVPCP